MGKKPARKKIAKKAASVNLNGKDLVSINQLDKAEILGIINEARKFEKLSPAKKLKILGGKVIATLFFEPSTRTKLSFQTAVQRLGGNVIGFDSIDSTSLKKGESFSDTIKIIDNYADAIVIRHPENGAAEKAAEIARIPVINAGDGWNEHPTQALTDIFTMQKEFGKIEGLTIGFLGDLLYGRTVRSLSQALLHFNPKKFYLISPQALKMENKIVDKLRGKVEVVELEKLDDCLAELDVLYVTRIQKERFKFESAYEQLKGSYSVGPEILKRAKKGIRIMHPLPRIGEIDPELDKYEQATYFRQAANGVFLREALMKMIVGGK